MKFPKATIDYSNLRALKENWGTVYQFKSRRFGHSLGINLLGDDKKICSYDCAYCELGETEIRMNDIKKPFFFKDPQELNQEISEEFRKVKSLGVQVDHILFVGNGEPTLYPDLDTVAAHVVDLRNQLFKGIPTGILTNGSHLDVRTVAKALDLLDLKMLKFDAGNDKMLKKINAPLVKDTVEKLIGNARRIENVIIQSCFVQGVIDNTKPEDLDDWIEVIGMIKPQDVHLYTLDRVPAIPGLKKVDEDTLYTISVKLEKRTRIKSKVFYS